MDRDLQRQIASKGGKAAHQKKTAHEFTPDEARAAGRRGGESVSQNRAHMAAIGRQGGLARRMKRVGVAAQTAGDGQSDGQGERHGRQDGDGSRLGIGTSPLPISGTDPGAIAPFGHTLGDSAPAPESHPVAP